MSAATVSRRPASGTLAEVIDIILDKGLVIDAYVRVSLVGIELLTIDIRVVVASVDTYLHFAEATNRLDLRGQAEEHDADLQDLIGGMAQNKTSGAIEGVKDEFGHPIESGKEKVKAIFGQDDEEEEGAEEQED
jgi:gas vesicle structural protein